MTWQIPNERRQAWNLIRQKIKPIILERDGKRCRYCGEDVVDLAELNDLLFEEKYSIEACDWILKSAWGSSFSIDHIIPISKGGKDDLENLCVCCMRCNSKKGNRRI